MHLTTNGFRYFRPSFYNKFPLFPYLHRLSHMSKHILLIQIIALPFIMSALLSYQISFLCQTFFGQISSLCSDFLPLVRSLRFNQSILISHALERTLLRSASLFVFFSQGFVTQECGTLSIHPITQNFSILLLLKRPFLFIIFVSRFSNQVQPYEQLDCLSAWSGHPNM